MTTTIPGFRWRATAYDPDNQRFETYRCVNCSADIKDRLLHLATVLREHRASCPMKEADVVTEATR